MERKLTSPNHLEDIPGASLRTHDTILTRSASAKDMMPDISSIRKPLSERARVTQPTIKSLTSRMVLSSSWSRSGRRSWKHLLQEK